MKKTFLLLTLSSLLLIPSCGEKKKEEVKVSGIEATLKSEKTYKPGEKIAKSDIVVKATYSDKSTKEVSDWTSTQFASNEYTVTEQDGANRGIDFAISFSGLSSTAHAYAFNGQVSDAEWDSAISYIENGNNGKAVQNFTCLDNAFDEEGKVESSATYYFEDGKAECNGVDEKYYLLRENGVTKHIGEDDVNKGRYFIYRLDDDYPTQSCFEDLDKLIYGESKNPKEWKASENRYYLNSAKLGDVYVTFLAIKGKIYLETVRYMFEGDVDTKYTFSNFGNTTANVPEANNLFVANYDKDNRCYEKTFTAAEFAENAGHVFDVTITEDLSNPVLKIYCVDDKEQANIAYDQFDMAINATIAKSTTDYTYSAKEGVSFVNPLKAGDRVLFLTNFCTIPSELASSSIKFVLRNADK